MIDRTEALLEMRLLPLWQRRVAAFGEVSADPGSRHPEGPPLVDIPDRDEKRHNDIRPRGHRGADAGSSTARIAAAPDFADSDELASPGAAISDFSASNARASSGSSPGVAEPCPGVARNDAAERLARIAGLEWSAFDADVASCTACPLCETRKRTVPGVGARGAEWLFIGEAPGAEEDAQGEPFVGQGGRLLDNMLNALGLARGDRVYIANVLKCRPPGNREPEPREVGACLPYLKRQIELVKPKLIVALGKSAATTLLDIDATLGSLRGRVHRYEGLPMIVTYHPAYLLRNLPDKAKAWEDLCLARATVRRISSGDLLQNVVPGPHEASRA